MADDTPKRNEHEVFHLEACIVSKPYLDDIPVRMRSPGLFSTVERGCRCGPGMSTASCPWALQLKCSASAPPNAPWDTRERDWERVGLSPMFREALRIALAERLRRYRWTE